MTVLAAIPTSPTMWPYHPALLATPVPRYTSFPTAAEFAPGAFEDEQAEQLARCDGEISLYLHIPYCEQICWYCGCNTGAAGKRQRLASYLDALHAEIALVGARLGRGARVTRIAFGGGSPNAIAPTDFVRLVDALTLHMPLDAPTWSIELDPRTMTAEWSAVLQCVGVTRASLGVQTFDSALQAEIGRIQPAETIERVTDLLRKSGVASLNFDMMYGLPGQDEGALVDCLERAVALAPERIALFGYAHVPHLLPRQRRIDASALPGQEERFAMAATGHALLTAAGYAAIGFDHFALPGDAIAVAAREGTLRRNFQGFTEDQAPVLVGLGASSISSFPGALIQNEKNAGRYRMIASQKRLAGTLGVRRDRRDQAIGTAIEAILCRGAADLGDLLDIDLAGRLAPFAALGLARIDGERLTLDPRALPYARTIAAQLDPYRQPAARRFSSAI